MDREEPHAPLPGARLVGVELDAWRGMLRAHGALTAELDEELERTCGVGLAAYDVLVTLEAGPVRRRELGDVVALNQPALAAQVGELAESGLLEEADGRVALTDAGRAALARARPVHLAGVRSRFHQRLSTEQLESLADIWRTLAQQET